MLKLKSEPEEEEKYYLMPTLSNGYIGTTVKNSSIYVNGLYNGYQSKSHRVRVPSMTNIEAFFDLDSNFDARSYQFDSRRGLF